MDGYKLMKVERNIDFVYGVGSIGLMGLVSQAVFYGGRHVLGYPELIISLNFFLKYTLQFLIYFAVLQGNS